MNTYVFSYCFEECCYLKKVMATSYNNALEKACSKLESLNEELDLIGITDWEEVVAECDNFGIYVSDLLEIDEL